MKNKLDNITETNEQLENITDSFVLFAEGEKLLNTSLEDVAKQTKPKPRFTEATFIKELQKREIGRPSTYATIVETVLSSSRGYCEIQNKAMVPTERGIHLIEFLDRNFPNIFNLEYTKTMEAKLDEVATGKITRQQALTEFFNTVETSLKSNKETATSATEQICPKCGAKMVLRRSKYGKLFYGCSNYPKCNGIVNVK